MPEYGNYFCSKGCLLEYNAGRDAFADEEDDRPFPIRRRPDSDEEPASINGAAGTSGAGNGPEEQEATLARSLPPTPEDELFTRQAERGRTRLTESPPETSRKSPRKSPEGAKAASDAEAKLDAQLQELISTPWLGKAANFDTVGKEILSHYEQRGVIEKKFEGGVLMKVGAPRPGPCVRPSLPLTPDP